MPTFTRFLRVVLLPVAVLAMVAGTSASASAAPLPAANAISAVVDGPASIVARVKRYSMNY